SSCGRARWPACLWGEYFLTGPLNPRFSKPGLIPTMTCCSRWNGPCNPVALHRWNRLHFSLTRWFSMPSLYPDKRIQRRSLAMKTSWLIALFVIVPGLFLQGQTPPPPPDHVGMHHHHELGKWWQNSDIAKKLQLTDSQVNQLDETFLQHRLKLIDYGADMEKQDLKLQTLLDADVPNEGQVDAQVSQVLAARGKLEREFTMMNLDLRKVLSVEQWRQLKTVQGEGMGHDRFFFHKMLPPPGAPGSPAPP